MLCNSRERKLNMTLPNSSIWVGQRGSSGDMSALTALCSEWQASIRSFDFAAGGFAWVDVWSEWEAPMPRALRDVGWNLIRQGVSSFELPKATSARSGPPTLKKDAHIATFSFRALSLYYMAEE